MNVHFIMIYELYKFGVLHKDYLLKRECIEITTPKTQLDFTCFLYVFEYNFLVVQIDID